MEVKVPAVGESITEATIAEWTKADGEFVNRDEPILVLETDKASVDIVAEVSGVLNIKVAEGETVEIGTVVAEIDSNAKADTEKPKQAAQQEEPQATKSAEKKEIHPDLKDHLSPAVSKIMAEKNLDPSTIEGTGKDGRLTKADVKNVAPMTAPKAAVETEVAKKKEIPPLPVAREEVVEEDVRKPMSQLRKTIAKRLVESQQSTATLTTFNEIDMTQLYRIRAEYKEKFEKKHGIRLGFMSFFVKAIIEGLKQFPAINGSVDGNDIVHHNYFNIGIAVARQRV